MEDEQKDNNRIKKIIIIGGGSAGWMAASYLSKALAGQVEITLIESRKIGRIGVGEATVPSIKEVLFDFLEIPEEEWMPTCNATFKLGIKYENWSKSLQSGGDYYHHIFGEMPVIENIPLSHIWMKKKLDGFKQPLSYACYPAAEISDHLKSPKHSDGTQAVHYAYQFDALKMADFLNSWSIKRGVTHIKDDIICAELAGNGNITSVIAESGEKYFADLFIDCSGFAGILIEKALKEPFISFNDSLLTDSAIAINLPANPAIEGIRPYTTATALSNGWMWQIPLYERSGNGYVFSSKFMSAEDAEKEMRSLFGKRAEGIESRHIKFRSGRRRHSWVKNCVSFGFASSFLEPLESTGLYFIYAALYQFVQHFPDKTFNPILQNKYNERIAYMVDDVRDFIVMHFCTSPRTDTPYWLANKHELQIPDSLKQILELQKAGVPLRKSYHGNDLLYSVFEAGYDRFWTNSNYQSVLSGVNYLPQHAMPLLTYRSDIIAEAEKVFSDIKDQTSQLLMQLPSHYDYLKLQKQKSAQNQFASVTR
jgi:tryptophan halogenase